MLLFGPGQSGEHVPFVVEVRDDGLAGALRTAGGGSSTQSVILIDGASVRSRKLLKREAARLMGLPETDRLLEGAARANNLTGDGVVVPVVTFLAAHVIEPLLRYWLLDGIALAQRYMMASAVRRFYFDVWSGSSFLVRP